MSKPKSDARLRAEAMATAISNRAAAREAADPIALRAKGVFAEVEAKRAAEARVADFFAAQERSNKARAELGIDS